MAILGRTGVVVHDAEAVERLHGAGARVGDDGRVRVPEAMVEWALGVAARSVTLHDRAGEPALHVGGDEAWFGPGSDCLGILDHYREHWYPTLIDRLSRPQWLARGGATLVERAAARVDRLLASHRPAPLHEEGERAIASILERAAAVPRPAPVP